jgi:HD superfamily phosphodiesterase
MDQERIELLPIPDFNLTPIQVNMLRDADAFAKEFFERSARDGKMDTGGHQYDHNQRVSGMAATIAAYEGHSPFLAALTGTLFDIGRTNADDPRSKNYLHGELSREMSADFLSSLLISRDDRLMVADAMAVHPRLNEFLVDNGKDTPLAKILQDADRLDSLGLIGFLRSAAFRWRLPLIKPEETDTSSQEQNITSIWQDIAYRVMEWNDMLWTDTARDIAKPRVIEYRRGLDELKTEAGFMYQAYKKLGFQQS